MVYHDVKRNVDRVVVHHDVKGNVDRVHHDIKGKGDEWKTHFSLFIYCFQRAQV